MSSGGEKNVEELKKLVIHTLETNGVLGQLRAQLRANVYKAIDEDEVPPQIKPKQDTSVKLMQSPVGPLMAEIVAEFFEFYDFRHSMSVFVPESHLKRERRSRTEVALDAGLDRVLADVSILEQLLSLATSASEPRQGDGWHSSASSTTASSPPPSALASTAMTRSPLALDSSLVPVLKAELKSPKGTSQVPGADKASRPDSQIGGRSKNLENNASPGRGGSPKATSGNSEESDQSVNSETCERAPDDANSARRKLGRKLPAMGGTKEHLSALKASQQNFPSANERTITAGSGSGDFSICESSVGVSGESFEEIHGNLRDYQQLNRRLARASGKSVACSTLGASPTGRDAINSGNGALGSPTTSPSNHEDRFGALSGSRSPENDNSSDRNSVLSGSRSPVSLPRANQSNSRSGSPATSPHSSAHSGGTQSEAPEEIVSLDGDDNSGSGSIDLALGRGTGGDTGAPSAAVSNTPPSQFASISQAPPLDNDVDVDDSIEEDVESFGENSHSGYESSEGRSGGF